MRKALLLLLLSPVWADAAITSWNTDPNTIAGDPIFSNENRSVSPSMTSVSGAVAVISKDTVSSGKHYFEAQASCGPDSLGFNVGVATENPLLPSRSGYWQTGWAILSDGTRKVHKEDYQLDPEYSPTLAGDTYMIALDADNGDLFFGKNGAWFGDADPVTGENPAFSGLPSNLYAALEVGARECDDPLLTVTTNFGEEPFLYDVPEGYFQGFCSDGKCKKEKTQKGDNGGRGDEQNDPPGQPPRPSGNLLINGDFELGNFDGWYDLSPQPWPYGGNLGAIQYGTESGVFAPPEKRSDDSEFSVLLTAAPQGRFVSQFWQRMPARPGDRFDFSSWIYNETKVNPGPFSLLKIVFEDEQGYHLEPAQYLQGRACDCGQWVGVVSDFVTSNDETETWHHRIAEGVAPDGTARVIFFAQSLDRWPFSGSDPARVWFDDLAVSVFPEDYSEQRLVDVQTILNTLNPDEPKVKNLVDWADQMFRMSRNDNISGAVALLDRILTRVDGCFYRGAPDQKGKSADWVDDCEIQVPLTQNLLLARDAIIQK